MLDFLKSKPVLDEASIHWMFEIYAWALENFDADVFYNETILVAPTNKYFPGREDSNYGMASLIFKQVQQYAGLKHWPCRLVDQSTIKQLSSPKVAIEGAIRGTKGIMPRAVDDEHSLVIAYNPGQVGNPEALIATFAQTLSHYLGSMARQMPPDAEQNWPHVTEVLAVFLGFGLMFSNSAFTYRNVTCSSCNVPAIGRQVYLSQYDITYALAIFSVLKDIPNNEVTQYLKKSLRSYYKKAVKDVKKRSAELEMLRAIA